MTSDSIGFEPPIPVQRIFDVTKAYGFYRDYLGFVVDWEYRFDDLPGGGPLYAQVSRASMTLHLSEHHGDGTPGTVLWIAVHNVDALHAELADVEYGFARPGAPEDGPGGRGFELIDPFGNVLRFAQSS
ncbi:glyoxalase superfamily protein [Nocardia callitridis]|uniref:Bleomycin resistance protein n=1 Tax=Nocardia callitridis TaxID=648753 RepID=A0ABP9K2G0_9NOCA